jgi:CHAT domain-containing protein/tetratricopeptide (TPR) repeat protein
MATHDRAAGGCCCCCCCGRALRFGLLACSLLATLSAWPQGRPPAARPASESPPPALLRADNAIERGDSFAAANEPGAALQEYLAAWSALAPSATLDVRAALQLRIGLSLHELGRYAEAIESLQHALSLQAGTDPTARGRILHALGDAQARLSPATALVTYAQALRERQRAGDTAGEARTRLNRAYALADEGRYAEALDDLQTARLALARATTARPADQAALRTAEGLVQTFLGQHDAALQAFTEAQGFARVAGNRAGVALNLMNVGAVHIERHAYGQAYAAFEQARDAAPPGADELRGQIINGLGYARVRQGRGAEAVPLLREAVALQREVGRASELARALDSLGGALAQVPAPAEAQAIYLEAVLTARQAQLPEDEREALFSLGRLAVAQGQPAVAILWLKQAVNLSQRLRAGTSALRLDLRSSYASRLAAPYQLLAQLLIGQGRIAEGESVLMAMKEAEFRDFTRGDGDVSAEVPLTDAERALADRINTLAGQLVEALVALNAESARPGTAGSPVLARLRDNQLQLNRQLVDVLADVERRERARGADATLVTIATRSKLDKMVRSLRDGPLAERAVSIVYVPDQSATTVLLMTGDGPVPLELSVGLQSLEPQVRTLRERILSRAAYESEARRLHAQLVAPVERRLAELGLGEATWLLFLSDSLRYLPFAALVDESGRHVVERHRLVVLTTPELEQVSLPPITTWRVAGFGSTQPVPRQNLGPLPAARAELRGIVRSTDNPQGLLPGTARLDAEFTREAWMGIFQQGSAAPPPETVVHVASHFKAAAGDWSRSFLVLGEGSLFSMSELSAAYALHLDHLDLITLSACATEVNDQARGRELEGMGVALQRLGARSVIGTLWTIQDEASALLTQAFYRARGETRRMSKAAALQQAQLDLLQGRVRAANPAVSLAHPYYWAPFILMGNWQ